MLVCYSVTASPSQTVGPMTLIFPVCWLRLRNRSSSLGPNWTRTEVLSPGSDKDEGRRPKYNILLVTLHALIELPSSCSVTQTCSRRLLQKISSRKSKHEFSSTNTLVRTNYVSREARGGGVLVTHLLAAMGMWSRQGLSFSGIHGLKGYAKMGKFEWKECSELPCWTECSRIKLLLE